MASQSQGEVQFNPAPIAQLVPLITYLFSAGSSVTRALWDYTWMAIGLSLTPISLLVFPLLGFVFAPLLASLSLIIDAILTPYYIVVYVAQAIYPLYVIAGAAVICGAIVGLFARQVIAVAGKFFFGGMGKRGRVAARPLEQIPPAMRSTSKGKKRASVKFESTG
jgi:hypothetical protein